MQVPTHKLGQDIENLYEYYNEIELIMADIVVIYEKKDVNLIQMRKPELFAFLKSYEKVSYLY